MLNYYVDNKKLHVQQKGYNCFTTQEDKHRTCLALPEFPILAFPDPLCNCAALTCASPPLA